MPTVSPFAAATSSLLVSLQRFAGDAVTYDDGTNQIEVDAIPGTTSIEVVDQDANLVRTKVRDWKIRRVDLIVGNTLVTPAVGHTIAATRDDGEGGEITDTWQVVPAVGDRHARPFDLQNEWVRIHTQLIGEV